VEGGVPVLEDGSRPQIANVIWCTGFRADFAWLDPDLLDNGGMPRQQRGVALDSPGLFFLGQDFMYAVASATLPGVCRDARHLAAKMPAPANRGSLSAAA
jgi:putative flavoprotein involved in K+ transport